MLYRGENGASALTVCTFCFGRIPGYTLVAADGGRGGSTYIKTDDGSEKERKRKKARGIGCARAYGGIHQEASYKIIRQPRPRLPPLRIRQSTRGAFKSQLCRCIVPKRFSFLDFLSQAGYLLATRAHPRPPPHRCLFTFGLQQ